MLRIKNLVAVLAIAAAAVFAAQAQTSAPVRGVVKLQKADGTQTPVTGATVESYRVDLGKGAGPSSTTNKKGEFTFVGFQLGGMYALAVSGPGISPVVEPQVKAGNENVTIIVSEGDGRKPSEEEVREFVASGAWKAPAGTKPGAKTKEQEELERKNAEIMAKNKDLENRNEIIQRAVKEGNDAYTAKNYDIAIVKYTEGIDADPDFVGSAPILLSNRSLVLRDRARDLFNQTVKSADATTKLQNYAKVKKDLGDAADGFTRALNVIKNAPAADIKDANAVNAQKTKVLQGALEIYQLMVRSEQVDPEKIEQAKVILNEYSNAQTDAAKKIEAKLTIADLYRVAADSNNAIAAYKDILATNPDNVDALAGAGLSLVNLGFLNTDKAAMQEGANFLQKFIAVAPETHRYKQDAAGLIEALKAENVAPQKASAPKKKP
jgi:tetratricopeptide (TPR) repeat protein